MSDQLTAEQLIEKIDVELRHDTGHAEHVGRALNMIFDWRNAHAAPPAEPRTFSVEAAKAGEPVLLDGKPVKFLMHVPEAKVDHRVLVLRDSQVVTALTEDGRDWPHAPIRLTMAPPAPKPLRTVWVNFYADREYAMHESEIVASQMGFGARYVAVPVTLPEKKGQ